MRLIVLFLSLLCCLVAWSEDGTTFTPTADSMGLKLVLAPPTLDVSKREQLSLSVTSKVDGYATLSLRLPGSTKFEFIAQGPVGPGRPLKATWRGILPLAKELSLNLRQRNAEYITVQVSAKYGDDTDQVQERVKLVGLFNTSPYPTITSVTLRDHEALIEGRCDAPEGTLLVLVPTGSYSFGLSWSSLRVGEGGRFQVTLSLRNLITGYSVVAADTREELVSPGKATHVVVAPALFFDGLVEEGRIYFSLILLAYLATGLFLVLRANRLGIQRGCLWLLLPLAGVPLLLQGRPKAAWLAQALQSLLLSHNLLSQIAASEFYNPRVQVVRLLMDATVWWLGWAAGFYWASRQATAEREPAAPDPKWAWACLIPQALVRTTPGLAQLLQGRAGRGLTFLFAALAFRAFLEARLWWAFLSLPPLLLMHDFEAVTKYDGLMLRTFGFEALFLLCLAEAAWFAWRAGKLPRPLAEEEAKAG